MHEAGICQALLQTLQAELDRRRIAPDQVSRLVVGIGALRQVVPEFMHSAFELLTADTPLEKCSLEIQIMPFTIVCGDCGRRTESRKLTAQCPFCRSEKISIEGGDQIMLLSFAYQTEEEPTDQSDDAG